MESSPQSHGVQVLRRLFGLGTDVTVALSDRFVNPHRKDLATA